MDCCTCHGTGFVSDGDDVEYCDDPNCTYWTERNVSRMARSFANDPRFTWMGKSPEWWQGTLDYEERAKNEGAYMRRSL